MNRRNCSTCCGLAATLFLLQGFWVAAYASALRARTERSLPKCPEDWDTFGDKCYRLYGGSEAYQRQTWTEANRKCTEIGSTLVSIHSMQEQAFVAAYVSRVRHDIWIGLHRPPLEDTLQWTDNSPLDFTHWDRGEPNDYNNEEDCVHMNYISSAEGTKSTWNDHRCTRVFPYICQVQRSSVGTCGGDIFLDRGVVSSPNYPDKYGRNAACTWRITVPDGYLVSLRFNSFKVEEDSKCNFDYVRILDGHESSSPVLRKFCGYDIPDVTVSSGNKMSIEFKSDNSYQYEGFTAEYKKRTAVGVELQSLLRQMPYRAAQQKKRNRKNQPRRGK